MEKRENWSSRFTYIMTVAGATVGFGSTWRFPYLVGENGGGAFLVLFLICIFLLGVPLIMAESVIGRRLHQNNIDSFKGKNISKWWQIVGYMGCLGAFGILAYYMVLGGWVLNYIVNIGQGHLHLDSLITKEVSSDFFEHSIANVRGVLFYTFCFVLINYYILAKGIIQGIENAMRFLMPLLLLLLILVIVRSLTLPNAWLGVKFYLTPDFSKIGISAILAALGQVFFALSIGFGVMITLASYLHKEENIVLTASTSAVVNTVIAFLAGFMIFPSIFAFGLAPDSGPSLVFKVLPIVFSSMVGGTIFAFCFFSLLLIAALTSSLSIYEVIITSLIEKTNLSRKAATIITLSVIFILGNVPSALAYSSFSNIIIFGKNIFDLFDYISANILFISTALLSAIFVGYVIKDDALDEITNQNTLPFKFKNLWINWLRYVIPLIIIVIFISSVVSI